MKHYNISFSKQNSFNRSGIHFPNNAFSELIDVAKSGCIRLNKTGRHVAQKRFHSKKKTPGVLNRSPGKTELNIYLDFSFSLQLYALKQIINVLLQTENISGRILRNHSLLTLKETTLS